MYNNTVKTGFNEILINLRSLISEEIFYVKCRSSWLQLTLYISGMTLKVTSFPVISKLSSAIFF